MDAVNPVVEPPNSNEDDLTGIDCLPSGRFRFRVYHGRRVLTGTALTAIEAKKLRDEVLRQIFNGDLVAADGLSLKNIGPRFLASRSGNRDTSNDESRWHNHILKTELATKAMATVTRADALLWLEELRGRTTQFNLDVQKSRSRNPLSWQTRKHCVNLVRRAFAWAVERDLAPSNPFQGLLLPREDGDEDDGYQECWYLDATEQQRLLACFDQVDWYLHAERRRMERWLVAFAFTTGLRRGEQWCLHLADVDTESEEPHLVVRYGSWDPIKKRYRPPKGRKGEKRSRRVPLWGPSLDAARQWLKFLPRYAPKNPLGLVFPTERGKLRGRRTPRSWDAVAKQFGNVARIGRAPWWHLLRHTCASSMLSGAWGLRWGVEDVQKILGHQDVRTTQGYAHLAPAAVQETALRANERWNADRHATVTPRRGPTHDRGKKPGHARQESNLRHPASKAGALSS